jgi:hypothetical protein
MVLALMGLALLSACASSTTRIAIQSRDWISMGGQPKFEVGPGDELEVLYSKPCRGVFGTCWCVRNLKTGETGFVSQEHAEKVHRVYKTPKVKSQRATQDHQERPARESR